MYASLIALEGDSAEPVYEDIATAIQAENSYKCVTMDDRNAYVGKRIKKGKTGRMISRKLQFEQLHCMETTQNEMDLKNLEGLID